MRIEVKAFGRKKTTDTREQCGSLTFKADNDVDAVQLAALANAWCYPKKGRHKNLTEFRAHAIESYAKKHNLRITVAKDTP